MSLPVRSLPMIQNWDCHSCTNCCRGYVVRVTQHERERIEQQGWDTHPELTGVTLFDTDEGSPDRWRLAQTDDGACVFLDNDNLCQIHARFGEKAKPLACRMYPFLFVPVGDHWRVGLRFGCPSVVSGKGRGLVEHLPTLSELATEVETRDSIIAENLPEPPMPSTQTLPWSDVSRIVLAFTKLIDADQDPLERRLRRCLNLIRTCQQARFDKIKGRRLDELLSLLTLDLDAEVPTIESVPRPGWIGRLLFRQLLSVYTRCDTGPSRRELRFGRLGLLWAAIRFALGYGQVPKLNADMGNVRFGDLESISRPMPDSVQEWLSRYYRVKLESMQFFGRGNFGMHLWEGLASLFVTFPVIGWLARAMPDRTSEEAFAIALRAVDDHFGANLLLGSPRQVWTIRMLADRAELDRLIAQYAR